MNNTLEVDKLTHELKNPLTVCKGYLEIMKKDNKTNKYLNIINNEIKRCITIINDYSNDKLKLERVDLSSLFNDLTNTLDKLYRDNNTYIITEYNTNLYILGDYNKLKQAFLNIIKNAYESKDKNILTIKIKIIELKNYYKISIIDNGCGIPKDKIKYIYNEYYTTKESGTGIGIPFIKSVIEKHKGIIKYKSIETKGTSVIIKLKKS